MRWNLSPTHKCMDTRTALAQDQCKSVSGQLMERSLDLVAKNITFIRINTEKHQVVVKLSIKILQISNVLHYMSLYGIAFNL